MAKKISLQNIVERLQNFLSTKEQINFDISYSSSSTSDSFDQNAKIVLEHFLPLYILLSLMFYQLEKQNDKLPSNNKKILKSFISELSIEFNNEQENNKKSILKYHQEICKRMYNDLIDLTKLQYFQKEKKVQFDDKGSSHIKAFRVNSIDELPGKNILLKLKGPSGENYRFGIKIEDSNSKKIIVMNMVNKRTNNK